jgi:hypothetical protein
MTLRSVRLPKKKRNVKTQTHAIKSVASVLTVSGATEGEPSVVASVGCDDICLRDSGGSGDGRVGSGGNSGDH